MKLKGLPIDDSHYVTRLCGRGVDEGVITSAAFALRKIDKLKLSLDWVECKHVPDGQERTVAGSLNRLRAIAQPQPVAVLQVSRIRAVQRGKVALDVRNIPTKRNYCHSAIVGFSGDTTDHDLQVDLSEIANESEIVELI